ncbi:MAG: hypothetical protein WA208_01630 [Thermoanaerobaculia bacterium]
MSRTLLVWTDMPVQELALRAFAEGRGGYWNEVVGGEAVIERGNARVFIAVTERAEEAFADDLDFAVSEMGSRPASMLSIRIGHAEGSVELAEEIAAESVANWGGFLDRNQPA